MHVHTISFIYLCLCSYQRMAFILNHNAINNQRQHFFLPLPEIYNFLISGQFKVWPFFLAKILFLFCDLFRYFIRRREKHYGSTRNDIDCTTTRENLFCILCIMKWKTSRNHHRAVSIARQTIQIENDLFLVESLKTVNGFTLSLCVYHKDNTKTQSSL